MSLPYFNRSQLGVIVLLGAGLVLLWAWRANFFLAPSPPPPQNLAQVFVEVRGAVAYPGVFTFAQPPTLAEVVIRAGAAGPPATSALKLGSGSRVEVGKDGQCALGRMSGPQLLTLGLALDLNTATLEDLDALPGIGPALAKRIIDYRQAHGPFKKIDDLLAVPGIGPHNLQNLQPHLVLGSIEAVAPEKPVSGTYTEPKKEMKAGPGSKRAKPKAPGRVINLNQASQKDLEALPGIGPVLARRILNYRQAHGPFKKIDDLLKVSGIGPKKLEKMKPYLVITESVNLK